MTKRILLKIYTLVICMAALLIANPFYGQHSTERDSLINVITNTDDNLTKLKTYSLLIKYNKNGIGEEGKLYLDYAIELSNDVGNTYYTGIFHCFLAEYYMEQGNYSTSLETLQEALSIGEKIHSDSVLTHAHIDIAIIFYYWNNYEKAEEHILKALNYAEKGNIPHYFSTIYNLLGGIYGEKKEPKKAKIYMLKYLKSGKKYNRPSHVISAYNNLALISRELNQMDSAMHYSNLGLEIAQKNNDIDGLHTIYISLIRIYLASENYPSAHQSLLKALALNENSNSPRKILFTYKYAYNFFKTIENTDSALYFHEVYIAYKDSLFSNEQFNKITDLQVKLETEQHNVVIKNLETKNRNKTMMMIAISSIMVLILAISFLIYRSYRLKNNLIRHEKALLEEKSSSMKTKMDFQQREMAFNAMYIVSQNKIYDGIIKNLNEIDKLPKEEWNQAIKATTHKIQKNKKTVERKGFEIKFKKSHQDFYKKLTEQYPTLTKKDMDLCAYLKLDMSTKEIATLTNQSIRALEVARSRLRKKLGIESHINLADFIKNI